MFRIDAVLEIYVGGRERSWVNYVGTSLTIKNVDVDKLLLRLQTHGCRPVTQLHYFTEKDAVEYTKVKIELCGVQGFGIVDISQTHIATIKYLGKNVAINWEEVVADCQK